MVVFELFVTVRVAHQDSSGTEIDQSHLMVDSSVDAVGLKLLGGPDFEIIEVLDPATNEVRFAAG